MNYDAKELERVAFMELDAWFNSKNPLDWGSATLIKFRLAEVLGIPRKLAGELHVKWANARKVKSDESHTRLAARRAYRGPR